MISSLSTPTVLVDSDRLEANLAAMQSLCNQNGVELRPHVKTHKMVEVARRQLQCGAAGLTSAKIGEIEALMPAFEGQKSRQAFVAHSLVAPEILGRLEALREQLDHVFLAVTSLAHASVLERILAPSGKKWPILLAFDTGLEREGARNETDLLPLAAFVARSPHFDLYGLYTHEGHLYGATPDHLGAGVQDVWSRLQLAREAVERDLKIADLKLWPGCSVSAHEMACKPGVSAVRPGAYVFGDLALCEHSQVMTRDQTALRVVATVVDKPASDFVLIDAGSKTFSGDRTPEGIAARADGLELEVFRLNEEHGYVRGNDVNGLEIGQKIAFIPAHVCPVVNLADEVWVARNGKIADQWRVEARGKNR